MYEYAPVLSHESRPLLEILFDGLIVVTAVDKEQVYLLVPPLGCVLTVVIYQAPVFECFAAALLQKGLSNGVVALLRRSLHAPFRVRNKRVNRIDLNASLFVQQEHRRRAAVGAANLNDCTA